MTPSEIVAVSTFVLTATLCGTYLYKNVFGTDD